MNYTYEPVYHVVDKAVFDGTRDHNIWGIDKEADMERNYWKFECNINEGKLP